MPATSEPAPAPVFIGGTGRSGTTLLARTLGAHPRLFSVTWESQFIVARGGLLDCAAVGFDAAALERFAERARGKWFRREIGRSDRSYAAGLCADIDRDELEGALALLTRRAGTDYDPHAAAAAFVDELFGHAARRSGAARWCEKTPANLVRAGELQRLFPELRFVHIVRDGRDVVASILARGFWPIDWGLLDGAGASAPNEVTADAAARYWARAMRRGREELERLPAGSCVVVRLEDLVADTAGTLAEVCDFLGEPFDDALLDGRIRSDSIGRWRRDLDRAQADVVERIAGDELRRAGYG